MRALPKPQVILTHESDLDGLLSSMLLKSLALKLFNEEVPVEAYNYQNWKLRELREKSAWVCDLAFEARLDKPDWVVIDRTGQFEWHDHRIHWMSTTLPPEVKNQNARTRIFLWHVPISIGAQRGTISGELYWVPEAGSSAPVGAYVALAVIILASLGLVFYVRTRRRRGDGGDGPDSPDVGTPKEAW